MNSYLFDYVKNFLNTLRFPLEAQNEILNIEKRILLNEKISKTFLSLKLELMSNQKSLKDILEEIKTLANNLNISHYTLNLIFLINCTDLLLEKYKIAHIDEHIFWDTMDDFRYKLLECYEVKGVWGTFVPQWYEDFLFLKRFALGRFQYEEKEFDGDLYTKNGFVLNKGDKIYNFHIPSSGQPIDKLTRFLSYRKAYEFFDCKEKGNDLVLVCNPWLLSKGNVDFLPKSSNILDFMRDFDIVSSNEYDTFSDGWRVFGKHHELPLEQLPVDTSLRKSISEHRLRGGKMGYGNGIIVFDGEKIINY